MDVNDVQAFEATQRRHGRPCEILWYRDRAIALGDEELKERNFLVEICVKRLGYEYGNSDDVRDLINKTLSGLVFDLTDEHHASKLANSFRTALLDLIQQEFQIVAPNHLFHFLEDPNPIHIDTISMLPSELLNCFTGQDLFFAGDEYSQDFDNNRMSIQMPPLTWLVPVKASVGNAIREGNWLVDAAVSLIRLACSPYFGIKPLIGDVEPAPFEPKDRMLKPTIIGNTGVSIRSSSPSIYVVNGRVVTRMETPDIERLAHGILSAETGSCGYFFRQGLGWLSRGRQAEGHAQRALLFFTALETMLTRASISSPVSDPLARNIATILEYDVEKRPAIARVMKNLYQYRSNTVHKGERDVTQTQCNYVQVYAEAVFTRLLWELPFGWPIDVFWDSLDEASYGLSWPGAMLKNPTGQP